VAGGQYRGQFEERLKTIMKERMESQNAIIFIHELHTLIGAGSAEGSLDAVSPENQYNRVCSLKNNSTLEQLNGWRGRKTSC